MNPLPQTCGIAFKEWSVVCDALARGRQTLLLRKGGVAEHHGPGRFVPEHSTFWLYPTWVHQAEQGVRTSPTDPPRLPKPNSPSQIPIHVLVSTTPLCYIENEHTLKSLEPFHVLTLETLLKRFHYRTPGLWALAARAWCFFPGHWIEPSPLQAGCKTWVDLDQPLATSDLHPALDDAEWARLLQDWPSLLGAEPLPNRSESPHG